ncbi:MAG TPA: peptidylprolyl isomerase [Bacteroidia bacterium]|nr:peptidylprolyl isomerase [Bacteroidia bacterium]
MRKRNKKTEYRNVGMSECWKNHCYHSFHHSIIPTFLLITLLLSSLLLTAQPGKVIDQVVAVVGNKIILKSDIEQQYLQYIGQGNYANEKVQCDILDQLLLSKLLLTQAILDSVEVTDAQVQERLDRNMEYFIQQFGSQEKLETFYGKSVLELKDEYRPLVREQLLTQSMQQKITHDITASPADVKSFFESIPADSLPYINAEVEYAQIVKVIPVSAEAKENIKQKLLEYKKRVEKGEEFATLAVLYSQDGSAKNAGELGFKNRGDLVPEFEAVAFRLKTNEVSDVVETKFGYHLIQMLERRGERINVRHILLKPEIAAEDVAAVKVSMDSIVALIRSGKKSFSDIAQVYSDDVDTRYNGGNIVNQQNGTTRFESSQIDATVFFQLDKLQPGEISNPLLSATEEGKQAYKIFYLKTRTNPHKANLTDDYQRLQEAALQAKQAKALDEWVKKKKSNIFIRVADEYTNCENLKPWMN